MKLAGIDLAWQAEKNPSAVAVGEVKQQVLSLTEIYPACYGVEAISEIVMDSSGIAIDAPLIINNAAGQRSCETAVAKVYASRHAACHPSNLSLYPDPLSVRLAERLIRHGFAHFISDKWILECYPHPSLIEIFNLSERLKYKKGNKSDKLVGQVNLANLIKSLHYSPILPLKIADKHLYILDEEYILSLVGKAIKTNEDALDSIICLYIAALYQSNIPGQLFGDLKDGYIWIPTQKCI